MDVLLVLLIIFMVITPLTPHGLDALVPQPPKDRIKSKTDYTGTVLSWCKWSAPADLGGKATFKDQSGRRGLGPVGSAL